VNNDGGVASSSISVLLGCVRCEPLKTYEPSLATTTGTCVPCLTCAPGEYMTGTCQPDRDTQCAPCGNGTLGRTYAFFNCTGLLPTACAQCREDCGPGQYESSPCMLYADRQCTSCTASCAFGFYKAAECGGTGDRRSADIQCQQCSNDCREGWYEASPCTASKVNDLIFFDFTHTHTRVCMCMCNCVYSPLQECMSVYV
jgi:hypothetical protein